MLEAKNLLIHNFSRYRKVRIIQSILNLLFNRDVLYFTAKNCEQQSSKVANGVKSEKTLSDNHLKQNSQIQYLFIGWTRVTHQNQSSLDLSQQVESEYQHISIIVYDGKETVISFNLYLYMKISYLSYVRSILLLTRQR